MGFKVTVSIIFYKSRQPYKIGIKIFMFFMAFELMNYLCMSE